VYALRAQAKMDPNGVLRITVPKKSGSAGQQSIDVK
jgi:HSP20 family molecular chaperone IbpA